MKIKQSIRIKGDRVPEFKEGLGKGVIASRVIEFDETDKTPEQIASLLINTADEFIEDNIVIDTEEITEEDDTD